MKNRNRTMIAGARVVLLLMAPGALAQDWPQWRGVNRDGKVTGFEAPKSWPKQLAPKWKVDVGQGDATPALVGDRLFVFARQGDAEVTRCLEAATGKEVWADTFAVGGATGAASSHAGPRSSPAVADGKVVTLGVRGTVSCLDAASGKLLWRKDDSPGVWPKFFTSSSPIIVEGLCIAQLGGAGNGAVVAYDLATGEQKWKLAGDGPGYASPVLMAVDGTKLVVLETEKTIAALKVADGKLVWEAPFAAQGMSYNAATPIVDGATLIYCGQGRGTTAVKIEKQGDAFTAKELWSNPENSVQFATPVLKNNLLVGFSQRNDFFGIDARDGKTAWTAPLAPPAAGTPGAGGGGGGGGGRGRGGYGSVVDAGSVFLALTPASELVVFQASDKAYSEIARIKVADSPTYAYPVVSGQRLFVQDQNAVTLFLLE